MNVVSLMSLSAATAILVMIPGPNVALIVANSLRYGFSNGAVTVLGTTAGVAMQLLLVVIGMAAVVEYAADALTWIKWAGVVYLIVLGIRAWNEPATDLREVEAAPVMFWRGCIVAAMNPKTLLFSAAFLPQFVPAASASALQLVAVAGVFLAVLLVGDLIWAATATSARRLLARYGGARNRLTAGFLVAAGVGLALSRR